MRAPLRVGVAGVHGHGRGHVDAVLALAEEGVSLVAVADPRGSGEVPSHTAYFVDAADMIDGGDLDIVVLSTPIPTHAPLALRALEVGAHVLLEKPPVASVADHGLVCAASSGAGRAVQVGFQSLASAGVEAATDLVASGAIGDLLHIGAAGLWSRSDQYWARAPWAGHRIANGRVVADGAATNPLAHALATALTIAGASEPAEVEAIDLDMYRAAEIETDDTSSLAVTLTSGIRIIAALSVTAPHRHEPYVLLRGTHGYAVYNYTLDVLSVFRDGSPLPRVFTFARRGLLAELVAHARSGDDISVPIARTGTFTRVLEAITTSPSPAQVPEALITHRSRQGESFRIVNGVEEWTERAVWEGRTFAELGAPWAKDRPMPTRG
ncbi:Gfo/Idh/MocA family oxidoreductase [Microbacterium lacus]|uniref:Gfo/Idh/MocA family protein n=1 Tax=Microbacterium lacus TaxID=415217 RepID=UPI00385133DC